MRPLECILIFTTILALIGLTFGARRISVRGRALAGISALLAILQLSVEGYRWQMLPAYAGTAVVVGLLLSQNYFDRLRRTAARAAGTALLGTFLASAVLGTVYPIFRLPEPGGPYAIGTASYHLVDDSREEIGGSSGHREVMIQAWYPAAAGARGKVEPYRERAATEFGSAYLTLVSTHARAGVPVARSKRSYPVLLFSPSWHGLRNQSLFEVEALASHGFIVIGVDHPYGSSITSFPDGRVVRANTDAFLDTSSDETLRHSTLIAEKQVRVRALDLKFILDRLQSLTDWDPRGILDGHLDLTRIGAFGYSFGGAVVVEACRLDHRFKAAIDMDGLLFGEAATAGIEQPLLIMSDSFAPPSREELESGDMPRRRFARILEEQANLIQQGFVKHGGYALILQGFSHANYSDAPLLSPIRWLTGSGRIDKRLAMRIVADYTVGFFEKCLNLSTEPLLDNTDVPYPEARLIVYAPPGEAQKAEDSHGSK